MRTADSTGAFALLETMVGVAVFALGLLALGACVENCMTAERANAADQRARLALQNGMAEIESGAAARTGALDGMFSGITLKETLTPLNAKNEKEQDLAGLTRVELEADWREGRQSESKEIFFYVLR